METIVPRWEWRMFGAPPPGMSAALARLEPTATRDSDELYLLAREDRIVTIRDELMDITVLVETDRQVGKASWRPREARRGHPRGRLHRAISHAAPGAPGLVVSHRGLRPGVLVEPFEG